MNECILTLNSFNALFLDCSIMESGGIDIEDYEALPENLPASVHMIAGATAGITEHCIMYPIDCVKVGLML